MIYYTGDTHGTLTKIDNAKNKQVLADKDTLVILGDAGFNYYNDSRDRHVKYQLGKYNLTVLCIHGNHELRPETLSTYKTRIWNDGIVYYEEAYPYLMFAKDGEVYNLGGNQTLVCGGAYSVDKYYRLQHGWCWFADEQPSAETKAAVEAKLASLNWKVDQILTHTCPTRYIPVEAFIPGIDQSRVDHTTEDWLDTLAERTEYSRWLCGHWHIDKSIDNFRFVMNDFII